MSLCIVQPALNVASETFIRAHAERLKRGYPKLSFDEQRRFHFKFGLLPYYLRSNDHFTMAIPLEQRFPLLDFRLLDFTLQLPTSYLYKNGWTKYIHRKALEPLLPKKIVWRKVKMGFPFSFGRFLTTHRAEFEPLFELAVGAQIVPHGATYDSLLAGKSRYLWRACSTGAWLQWLGGRGVGLRGVLDPIGEDLSI